MKIRLSSKRRLKQQSRHRISYSKTHRANYNPNQKLLKIKYYWSMDRLLRRPPLVIFSLIKSPKNCRNPLSIIISLASCWWSRFIWTSRTFQPSWIKRKNWSNSQHTYSIPSKILKNISHWQETSQPLKKVLRVVG